MNLRILRTFCLATVAGGLAGGCAITIPEERKVEPLIVSGPELDATSNVPQRRSAMFLRTTNRASGEVSEPMAVRGVPLIDIIEEALPGFRMVPKDTGVSPLTPVGINTPSLPIAEFISTLENLTGLDMKVRGKNIEVRSFMTKEWRLPMLAADSNSEASVSGASGGDATGGGGGANGGGGGGGGGAGQGNRTISQSFNRDIDEWEDIIGQAEALLGSSAGARAVTVLDAAGDLGELAGAIPPTDPQIVHVQSIGYIRAIGPVARVRAVDDYLKGLERSARKQIRLDVRSIEVSITDRRARGINWNAAINTVFNDSLGRAGISLGADYAAPVNPGDGSLSVGGTFNNADERVEAIVQFLSNYGNVELRNNPQVTVFNGRTAYIGSGREFGYIASIERTVTNGVVVSTPTIARILIGVEVAITAMVTEDDKIALNVVPIISTFEGFDEFVIDGSQISQPRIVLNQLATQVIAAPGETIHLGGLVTSRLNEAVRGLPLKERGLLQRILSPAFSGENNEAERRELIIVVTPYLTNA